MACFQSRKPFSIEADNEMSDRITAFASCQLGGIGKGVAVRHRQHLFGMDHLIGRSGQATAETFSLVPFFRA